MRAWQIQETKRRPVCWASGNEGTQLGSEAGAGGGARPCKASSTTSRNLSLSSEQWKVNEGLSEEKHKIRYSFLEDPSGISLEPIGGSQSG